MHIKEHIKGKRLFEMFANIRFWPQGHTLNILSRGPPDYAAYQISSLCFINVC